MININKFHITQTEAYNQLEESIYIGNKYQKLYKHYKELFINYSCNRDTANLKIDINNLFSKSNGIPFIFSTITFENNNTIYTNSQKVKLVLYNLKQKYFNKFNWHIKYSEPNKINDIFFKLYNDLEKRPRPYLKQSTQ